MMTGMVAAVGFFCALGIPHDECRETTAVVTIHANVPKGICAFAMQTALFEGARAQYPHGISGVYPKIVNCDQKTTEGGLTAADVGNPGGRQPSDPHWFTPKEIAKMKAGITESGD